jgi:pimeloyl-ACP methyl ester carboxylesterase
MKAIDHKTPVPFFRQSGTGSPVIALHGSASTGAQWTSLMGELEGNYRVIAPDLPGYGASHDVPSGIRSSLRAVARAIAEIAIAGGEPVHLVGHSYGGTVALKIAQVWPELVRSLTLIEPAAFHYLGGGDAADRALLAEIRFVAGIMSACVADDAPEAGMAGFVDYWNGEGCWANLAPEQRQRLTLQIGAVLANFSAGFAETTPIEDCATITCPVQVIMGLQSKAPAQRVAEMVAETIPGARLTLFAEAGHMMPITHAGVVNKVVARHISACHNKREVREPEHTGMLPRWVA